MSNRNLNCAIALIGLTGLWACWCDTAMIWDGAYQFCTTLITGKPFFYLSRFHSGLLWAPLAWLSGVSDNLRLLKMAYGAPFCLAPLASVLLCWWVLRRNAPYLMIWAFFGAAIAALPGQIFMINDSIFQMHMFWPVFFAAFLRLTWPQFIVIVLVSLFQLSHPVGIGLCGLLAAALAWAGWKLPSERRIRWAWAAWHLALALGGIIKLFIWPDSYAAQEANLNHALGAFATGVLGWPIIGLLAAWRAGQLLLRAAATENLVDADRDSRRAFWLVCFTGLVWFYWGASAYRWTGAINYRRWVAPMSIPFMAAAVWELWLAVRSGKVPPPRVLRWRARVAFATALVFYVTLGSQSCVWLGLYQSLGRQVAAWPSHWMPESSLAWARDTSMDHWGVASQMLALQGREPRVLLDRPEARAGALARPPQIALSPFTLVTPNEWPRSWFHWGPLLDAVHPAKSETSADSTPLPTPFLR